MALIMAKTFRGRGLLRASVLIPWAIPTAVTAKLWFFIFANDGIANKILGTNILWTADPWPARFAIVVADVWKTAPFMALLILAGLQMIPADVYEAAKVDGATPWQAFRMVLLPMAVPILVVVFLLSFIGGLRTFDLIWTMTRGGPGFTTDVITSTIYKQYQAGFYGLATAGNVILFFVVTNFGTWLGSSMYPQTAAGLTAGHGGVQPVQAGPFQAAAGCHQQQPGPFGEERKVVGCRPRSCTGPHQGQHAVRRPQGHATRH